MSQAQIKQVLKSVDESFDKAFETHQDLKNLKKLYKKQLRPDMRTILEQNIPKGKNKKTKDPNAPKRPKTAFLCFQDDMRAKAIAALNKKHNKGKKQGDDDYVDYRRKPTEVSRYLGEQWRKMKDDETKKAGLKKYIDQAEKDKKRYHEQIEEYHKKEE